MGRRQRQADARLKPLKPVHDHLFQMDRERDFRRDLRAQAVRAQNRLPLQESWAWVETGPGGIDIEARVTNSWMGADDIGGLVMDVLVEESPDQLALSTIMGGVWVSPIGGNGWVPRSEDLDALGFAALAHWTDGTDQVLYAASGSPSDERSRQIQSLGIARSTDGGSTWTVVDGGVTASRFVDRDVNGMVAFDMDRLLVATDQGLFYSVDGGRNFGASPGYDDGQPVFEGRITDLKSATVSGTLTFWFAVARDGLYQGTVPPTRAGITRIHRPRSVEGADNVGLILFDRVENGGNETWIMGVARHSDRDDYHSLQYRSPGQAWRKLLPGGASPPYNGVSVGQTTYNHVLTLDPDTPTRGFLGLVSFYRFPVPAAAPPAGWAPSQLSSSKIHADQHGSTWDTATAPSRLYVANDGGLYRTTDAGANWTNLNRTLRANLIYGMDVARRGTGWEILIGMQDTGNAIGKASAADPTVPDWSWTYEGGGDGGEVFFQPEGDTRAMQFRNQFVRVGVRANAAADFSWNSSQLGGNFQNDKMRFSGTVAWARNASGDWDDVYVGFERSDGKGRLYKSTDAGDNFTHLRPNVGGSQVSDVERYVTVMRTASSDASKEGDAAPPAWSHVWIGLVNGKVGKSTDGGASFTFMQPGPGLPVSALGVDPTDSSRVAVGYGGFTGLTAGPTAHVWLTEDGGQTWTDIGGEQVPDLPIYSLTFSRTNPVALFLGNDAGVLYTKGPNFGNAWTRIGLGLPRVRANALKVVDPPRTDPAPTLDDTHPPALFVGTHGRSVFRLVRPTDPTLVAPGGLAFGTWVGAGPVDRTLTLRNVGAGALRVTSMSLLAPFSLQGAPATPFEIPPGGSRDLTVRYAPGSVGQHTEHLNLHLDVADPLRSHELIACTGERVAAGKPRLGVDPALVGIPRGPVAGGQRDVPVRITNGGASDLAITGIDHSGSSDFSLLDNAGAALVFPLTVTPHDTLELKLRLATTDQDRDTATFTFHSNDPSGDRTLRAERPGPDGGFPVWATVLIIVGVIAVGVIAGILIADQLSNQEPETT